MSRKPSEIATSPLWDIAKEYRELFDLVPEVAEQNDGVIPDELHAQISKVEGTVEEKLTRMGIMAQIAEDKVQSIRAAQAALKDQLDRLRRAQEYWDNYTIGCMDLMGVTEGGRPPHRCSVKDCPPSVDDANTDPDRVPDEYCDISVKVPATDANKMAKLRVWAHENGAPEDLLKIESPWEGKRSVRKNEIIDAWKACGGATDIRGSKVVCRRKLKVGA